jgi:hypothetical protein
VEEVDRSGALNATPGGEPDAGRARFFSKIGSDGTASRRIVASQKPAVPERVTRATPFPEVLVVA